MKRISDLLQELDQLSNSVAKTVKRTGTAPVAPKESRRSLHLGLDYGTATSKMVLREYGPDGERAHIVFPSSSRGRARDFRIPSAVCLEGGRLWFGIEAAARQSLREVKTWASIKMRMASAQEFYGLASPLAEGISADDLATLTIAYLLQEGKRAADHVARHDRTTPDLTFTLGVPMSELDQSHLRGHFADIARRASHIVARPGAPDLRLGIPVLEGWMLVSEADDFVRRVPATDARRWVRSEVEAALLWPYKSGDTEPGVYAAVDVGAGTTSASFFQIAAHPGNGNGVESEDRSVASFGTSCLAPGADAVDQALVMFGNTNDPAAVRAKENAVIARVGEFAVAGVVSQICQAYALAFDRTWEKHPKPAAWDGYRLLLTGGGAEIDIVRRKLSLRAGPKLRHSPHVVDAAAPPDLEREGFTSADLKYLTVAYGLSHYDARVPSIAMPGESASVVIERPLA
ncbi:MAG: hypothetical protein ABI779_25895 [Acidobacteriota bacterium]